VSKKKLFVKAFIASAIRPSEDWIVLKPRAAGITASVGLKTMGC
jgi:hypothetical protein